MLFNYNEKKKYAVHLVAISDKGIRYEGEFIDLRINPDTIPEGKHWYHCRHDDDGDWISPVSIEPNVWVNFCGTLITDDPILWLDENDKYIEIATYWFEDSTSCPQGIC